MIRSTVKRATACAFLSSTSSTMSTSTAFVVNTRSKHIPSKKSLPTPTGDTILKPLLHSSPIQVQKARTFSSTTVTSSHSSDDEPSSSRGRAAVDLLPVYLTDARAVQKYHPIHAPDGALQLSVAENQMLEDLLVPALNNASSMDNTFFQDELIYYQPTHGRPTFRGAMASYLQRILHLNKNLDEEGLVLGAGCNAVLENLCFCLAEQGESVLIPTPYYAAFEFDLVARAGLNIVPVNTMDHQLDSQPVDQMLIPPNAYYPNKKSLDAALEISKANGSNPKILLLSHPNNPLGISYPSYVVEECIDWCRDNKVHLVSDEIYAGSIHGTQKPGEDPIFHSALALASTSDSSDGLGLGPYVHFVYALSKDFALSGLRVGVAYSENKSIRLPMQKLNDLCQISSQTQQNVERMLTCKTEELLPSSTNNSHAFFTDSFLHESNRRIRARYNRLQECLEKNTIPFLKADSGLFAWMDFREFLPDKIDLKDGRETEESKNKRERELYLDLLNNHGLLFTPGRSMKNELPGFFRCVFTAASDEEFELGLQRITRFVNHKRNLN